MLKKYISTLLVALLASATLGANAATLTYTGEVTGATGAFVALTPLGTPVGGPIEADDAALAAGSVGIADIMSINVNVGGFCFANAGGDCGGVGTLVPITSIDSAMITGTSGTLGGSFSVTAFSPTFNVSIPIFFDLDNGTFFADGGALGTVSGVGSLTAAAVPVPAAAWLLGSALLGMMGIRRRA